MSTGSKATLKIKAVTQDLTDPGRHRFVLQFTRDLTPTEFDRVLQKFVLKFKLLIEKHGPDTVVITNGTEGWFTLPRNRKLLRAAVAKAEAEQDLAQIGSTEGRAAARDDETRRKLAAINWDDDEPETGH